MLSKTDGIILRITKYAETTLIVKTYTRTLGVQHYIIKGIRSEKSKNKAAVFQPGNILQLDVYKRENKQLNFIKDFRLLHFFPVIRFDIIRSSVFLFILEILNKTLREEHGNEAMYDFLEHTFLELNNVEKPDPDFHLQFLIDWSGYLGFKPAGNFDTVNCFFDLQEGIFLPPQHASPHCMTPPLSQWLAELLHRKKTKSINNKKSRNLLLEQLLLFYRLHLPDFGTVHTPRILHEILQ